MRDFMLDGKFFIIFLLLYDAYRQREKYDLASNPAHKLKHIMSESEIPIDLLLLGDSVTERVSNKDQDTRPLYAMVADAITRDTNYYHISHSAYYMDIYHLYVELLIATNRKPKMIIMPINLRNFSPQWDYNPMFQNISHIAMLFDMLKQHNISPDGRLYGNDMSIWQYVNAKVNFIGSDYDRVWHFLRIIASKPKSAQGKIERRKNIFTFHYMNAVNIDDRKISHLADIIRLCGSNDIKLLIYFTPINYEAGAKYIGSDFTANLKTNVAMMTTQALSAVGDTVHAKLIDLSTLLTSEYFFNPDETTEHLADIGRNALCRKLIDLQRSEL